MLHRVWKKARGGLPNVFPAHQFRWPKQRFGCLVGLLVLSAGLRAQSPSSYAHAYPEQWQQAMRYYQQHAARWATAASASGVGAAWLFAIVAPELAHYSPLRDATELRLARALYAEWGSTYGNFSVGPCQMQPAFAELIEHHWLLDTCQLLTHPTWLLSPAVLHHEAGLRQQRHLRLQRLAQLPGQLVYLQAFVHLLQHRHPQLQQETAERRLRFVATAYNLGFTATPVQLARWETNAAFPRFATAGQFAYAAVALEFYHALLQAEQ